MQRQEPAPGSGSPGCPDLLRRVSSPRSPLYEGIPGAVRDGTPSSDDHKGAAALGAARGVPRRLLQASARQVARRSAGRPLCRGLGRSCTPRRYLGRSSRIPLLRARATQGLELPRATKGVGALATRPPRPAGTKRKAMSPAVPRPTGVGSDPTPAGCLGPGGGASGAAAGKEKGEGEGQSGGAGRPWNQSAAKAGGHRQPSQRLCTSVPTLASSFRPRLLGESSSPKRFCPGPTTLELTCNRTQELKEDGESKEQLGATGTVSGAGEQCGGKADLTWVRGESSFTSGLALGLTPECRDEVPAEQSADDQLSQKPKCVKNKLKRVKGKLADGIAQCGASCQTISSMWAQFRGAAMFSCWGTCPEEAAVEEESGVLDTD